LADRVRADVPIGETQLDVAAGFGGVAILFAALAPKDEAEGGER